MEQTIEILKGLKSRFEEHHNVKYALGALQAAAELSAKFINDRHLPDKAIDVIDEAGAAQRILPKSKQKKTITRSEVEEIVAKIARIPPASVSSDDRGKLRNLERVKNNSLSGCATVYCTITRARTAAPVLHLKRNNRHAPAHP